MIECISCLYEYQCDWAEAGHCSHYRPELETENEQSRKAPAGPAEKADQRGD